MAQFVTAAYIRNDSCEKSIGSNFFNPRLQGDMQPPEIDFRSTPTPDIPWPTLDFRF